MNDLLEGALDGLDTAHRAVLARPAVTLATCGFLVGAVVVGAGGRADAARADRPPSRWLGLQELRSGPFANTAAALTLAAVLALAALWVLALWVVHTRRLRTRAVWWVAAAWAMPFVLGPPLLDTAVYSYVAYGRLQRSGLDPYGVSPDRLGESRVVAAIDPDLRGLRSAGGPLASVLQHLVVTVSGGTVLASVILWRVLCLAAAVWAARLATALAATRSADTVAAVALSPLVLLYAVCSPHIDMIMMALVLAALVAARQRRWARALALAGLAAGIMPVALVAVPLLCVAHWFGRPHQRLRAVLARDVLVVAVTLAAGTLVQPHGLGWIGNVRAQFPPQRTPFAVCGAAQQLLALAVPPASYDDVAAAARLTALVAVACIVLYLIGTAHRRAPERSIGYALMAIALLGPVLSPWYLLWATLCLLPVAVGPLRVVLVGMSVAGCVLVPTGFLGHAADVVTGSALAGLAAITLLTLWWRYRDRWGSTPVGDLADRGTHVGQIDRRDDD